MSDPIREHPAIVTVSAAVVEGVANAVAATSGALGLSSMAAQASKVGQVASGVGLSSMLVQVHGKTMASVVVKDYNQITWYEPLREFGYGAWTNSATTIYLRSLPAGVPYNRHFMTLFHEGLHILQFRKHGGYPTSYQQMIEHEIEAYGQTVNWIDTTSSKFGLSRDETKEDRKYYARVAKSLAAEKKQVLSESQDPATREVTFRTFMLGGGRNKIGLADDGKTPIPDKMLPDHQTFEQLFGYPRTP